MRVAVAGTGWVEGASIDPWDVAEVGDEDNAMDDMPREGGDWEGDIADTIEVELSHD